MRMIVRVGRVPDDRRLFLGDNDHCYKDPALQVANPTRTIIRRGYKSRR